MTQGNFFTGTTAGGNGLEVTDSTTTNFDVNKIILGTGLSISSSLGRTVTIQSSGGGSGIGGSIAATQVAFGSSTANEIEGEAAFTYTKGTDTLGVGVVATTGTGVSVGGTGTITTNDGSISAGGASGSVAANTTVTAVATVTGGTGVTATTGAVTASAGQVVAAGTPDGSITGSGLVVAENSILKGTFTNFTTTGDIVSEGGALLLQQLGQSRWCNNTFVDMNTATGCINLSDIQFRGAQMQITAGAAGLVINAYAPTAPGTSAGTTTAVIGNGGQTKQIATTGQAIQITIPAFETVVLQVAGDLSTSGSYGYVGVTNNLGTGVLVVLGKCTLLAI
jgi:hypothetical protein